MNEPSILRPGEPVVVFHAGMGRTGSSALQGFCVANRETLEARGWTFPDKSELGGGPAGNANLAGIAGRWGVAHGEDDIAAQDRLFDSFRAALGRARQPGVLVTSERLFRIHPDFWAQARAACEGSGRRAVMLVYLREQREWLVSAYAHQLKGGRPDEDLGTYAARSMTDDRIDYHARYQQWCAALGAANVAVRKYQRSSLADGDVRRDLLHVLGLSADGLVFADGAANASSGLAAIGLMQLLGAMGERAPLNSRSVVRCAAQMGLPPCRDPYRLAEPALLRSIAQRCAGPNARLQALLQPGEPGPLFDSAIPDDYEAFRPDERFNRQSVELLLEALAAASRPKAARSGPAFLERRKARKAARATAGADV